MSPPSPYCPLDLRLHLDTIGITTPTQPPEHPDVVGFNIWGNTFPAEQLPAAGGPVEVAGVPFRFPVRGADGDNLRCRGQVVALPPGPWDWVHVLGAAERRTEDPLLVHYADGALRRQWLRMSDFWPETPPRFGEVLAFRCAWMRYPRHDQPGMAPAIWVQRVPVTVPDGAVALQLPRNPALHVFAMTAQRATHPGDPPVPDPPVPGELTDDGRSGR